MIQKKFPKEAAVAVAGIVKLANAHTPGDQMTVAIEELTPAVQKRLLDTILVTAG
jgi:hypothetical protein